MGSLISAKNHAGIRHLSKKHTQRFDYKDIICIFGSKPNHNNNTNKVSSLLVPGIQRHSKDPFQEFINHHMTNFTSCAVLHR